MWDFLEQHDKSIRFLIKRAVRRCYGDKKALAEELYSDVVLVKVPILIERYDSTKGASLITYVKRSLAWYFIRHVKRANRKRMSRIPDNFDAEFSCNHDTKLDVYNALVRLPPKQRAVVRWYHFEDMTFQEIADLWEMPKSSVRNLYLEAIAALKHELG